VKLAEFGLLTDENIDPAVVAWLKQSGFDVFDVCEQGLQGATDVQLLKTAVANHRLIVTHDKDFGTLAVLQGEPVIGVIYLRPGQIDPQFTIETIQAVLQDDPDVIPPFILVAKRTDDTVAIRIRQLT
jgi:predicted nuclease of predicted toxin-antitoxin system